MDLINLNFVFEKHYEALKENSETREIIINFMLLPAFFSAILVCFGFNISNGFRSALITSIAIFVGFLINVLILINTTKDRKNENNNQNNQVAVKREEVIQELFIHTLYSIIIGLILLTILIVIEGGQNVFNNFCIYAHNVHPFICQLITFFASWIVFFLFFHFLLTLLLIIKRVYVAFDPDIEKIASQKT